MNNDKWIHVTDSLPGHNRKVLALLINENNVKRKYEVITARYDIFGNVWYDCENHVYRNSKNIPYWQELPNIPNKERLIKNET
jgi:hypothetical protein